MKIEPSSELSFKELIYRTNAKKSLGQRLSKNGFDELKCLEAFFARKKRDVILDTTDGSNNTKRLRAIVWNTDGKYRTIHESFIERIISPLIFIKRVYWEVFKKII